RASRSLAFPGVALGPEKVQGHVNLVADDPAVVRHRRDVEELTRPELDDPAVLERRRGRALEDHPPVLHVAPCGTHIRPHVLRPPPPPLIGGATDGYAADPDNLQPALGKAAPLVGPFESFEDYIFCAHVSSILPGPR